MENPLVSIVIPVYNGSNYMRCAIDSALSQTYPDCEVIVINDGSTDDGKTDAIARSYGDKIRYLKKENGGVATAVNMGIKKMKGEYFAWLSHDDMFYSNKIELQMKALKKSGNLKSIVHGNFDFYDVETDHKEYVDWPLQYPVEKLEQSVFPIVFLCMHGSSVLIHKSHFERCGLYRADLKATQDSELLFRILRGQKSVFVREPLLMVRRHIEQGQKTMKCFPDEYGKMFLNFSEILTNDEKTQLCGSEKNFYYRVYNQLSAGTVAKDSVKEYFYEKMKNTLSNNKITDMKNLKNLFGNRPLYLFGAGVYGKLLSRDLKFHGITIDGFIDNDKQKHGKRIEDIMCYSLDDIDKENSSIIISMLLADDVRKQLEKSDAKHIFSYYDCNRLLLMRDPTDFERSDLF